jgi:uncharacterized membrane protein
MDETPKGPEDIPSVAANEPEWGPPNPNYTQQAYVPPAAAYAPPAEAPPAAAYPPGTAPPGQYPPPGYAPAAAGLSTNTAAALAYLTFIPAIIFLVLDPYRQNSLIRFHACQCIVLTLVDIAGGVVFSFLGTIGLMLRGLLGLVLFVFWLIAIIQASRGERYHVPIVGDLAESMSGKV